MFAQVDKNRDFVVPSKEEGSAGYDVYASLVQDSMVIEPFTTRLVPTNMAYHTPKGYYFQVEERGSTGSRGIKKSAGVLDGNFTGETFVALTNTNDKPILITKETDTEALEKDYIVYPYSKAIAQMILHKVDEFPSVLVDYSEILNLPTERGTGMLGSSGK